MVGKGVYGTRNWFQKSSSRAVGDEETEGVCLVRNHAGMPRSGRQGGPRRMPKAGQGGNGGVRTQPGVWNKRDETAKENQDQMELVSIGGVEKDP